MNISLGIKSLWIIFWGHHKIGLYVGVISMHFNVRVQNGGYFFGLVKISNIFGVLEIPYIFWVNGRCWTRAYV